MDPSLLRNPAFNSPVVDSLSDMPTQRHTEKNLKFICEFSNGSGPQQASGKEDYNFNTASESVSVILPDQCTVYQLRLGIGMQVGQNLIDLSNLHKKEYYYTVTILPDEFSIQFIFNIQYAHIY